MRRLFVATLMVSTISWVCVARQSNPPTPTPREVNKNDQNKRDPKNANRQDHDNSPGKSITVIYEAATPNATKEDKDFTKKAGSQTSPEWWISPITQILITLFTFGLVVTGVLQFGAAVLQFCAMQRQATLIKEQAEFSYKAFVLTKRPRLVVRNLTLTNEADFINYLRGPEGTMRIVNIGETVAYIRSFKSGVCIRPSEVGPLPTIGPVFDEATNTKLPSGKYAEKDFASTADQDTELGLYKTMRDKAWVYVYGQVIYWDELQNVRITQFCRLFDWDRRKFIPVDDPDNENSD